MGWKEECEEVETKESFQVLSDVISLDPFRRQTAIFCRIVCVIGPNRKPRNPS